MSQEESKLADESLTDQIKTTRRRLLGGLGAGAGAASAGLLTGAGSRSSRGERLYKLHWTCVYDHERKTKTKTAFPRKGIQTRDEIAADYHETSYSALPSEKRKSVDRAFGIQFHGHRRQPILDFTEFEPGKTGSMEFSVHILERPVRLRLEGTDWHELDSQFAKRTDATLRYRECPKDTDATIVDGSLADVLTALKRGIPLDGNRSYGARGPFDEETTHGFELEWEVPEGVTTDRGHFEFDFEAKAVNHPKKDANKRTFTVHAIDVDIVHNKFGTHNPQGAMYVLEENLEAVREAEGVPPGTEGVDTSVIEPLVIRANEGETVEIEFVNSLGQHPEKEFPERPASIHPTGVAYEADKSDGLKVGFNENTVVAPGESTTYTWHADKQGTYFFHDGAFQAWDSTPGGDREATNSMSRGLFGAIVVEPEGATWTDPCTGAPLRSGTRADIHVDHPADHREFVVLYHDHGVIRPELPAPGTDILQSMHALNYRAERTSERIGLTGAPEESFYSSWVHGDPGGGDMLFEAYEGDPVKFITIGANPEENHVHHLHNHRWNEIPGREDSNINDSQTIGMGQTFEAYLTVAAGPRSLRPEMTATEAFEFGAGGFHGSVGDLLFHCHMFPHYGEGMNGHLRIHDKEQLHLQPLPNNDPQLPIDSPIPGFPDFIPTEAGEMPPKPPLSDGRQPTETEQEALGALVPGAPNVDPCDIEGVNTEDDPDIVYNIVAIPNKHVYNDHGDFDPDGKVFVLEEDAEAVKNGEMMPEPLIIRANVGDCVELNLRNELDVDGGTSIHPHFVSFDPLGTDSAAVGFNYDQGAYPDDDEPMTYRWLADQEGVIIFHDHFRGIGEVMHGEFGALMVEPAGSEWLDPHTGDPIQTGSQAIINPPDDEAFREFCLGYNGFAPLIDGNVDIDEQPDDPEDERFVNPHEQHEVNAGVGAINYRNAPYYRRGPDPDPAYVHSSWVHGDPPTPTLETYPDDPVKIRLFQLPYEEQHNFGMHGVRPNPFGFDPEDAMSQIIGPSEQFTFEVLEADAHDFDQQPNPAGLPVRDYLYGSMVSHDLWDGMWGIHRVFGAEVDHLHPLPDRNPPEGKITEKQLQKMGHPAPFDRRKERGHRAKLTFDEPREDPTCLPDRDARRNEFIEGNPPPKAASPGDPCPDATRTLEYDVTALQTRIDFNDHGDHDPHGIVYALDEHVDDIKKGDRSVDPLLLRANVNDCIEVTLTNALGERDDHDDHPQMRTPEGDLSVEWRPSNRISLHAQQLTYDVNGSDGATVGFNFDQTIGPGESITYRWFADEETEPAVLWDMADMRSNHHHGAFGQLIVEPEGSEWLDAHTGEPTVTSPEAIISPADDEAFREFCLAMSDGRYIVNEDGTCVVPKTPDDPEQDPDAPCNQIGDPEDQGYMAFSNRSEPFARRFETDPRQEHVYDSAIHGDPATPVFNAHVDDPVKFRVGQTAGASRGISFHLANHRWERFRETELGQAPLVPAVPHVGVDARFTPGKSVTFDLIDGAGGTADDAGDFLYKEMKERRRLESGAWGIFRVSNLSDDGANRSKKAAKRAAHDDGTQPLPKNAGEVPLAERPGWNVATADFTGDGSGDVLIGVPSSDRTGENAGAAYLFYGPVSKSDVTSLADADAVFLGESKGDRAGTTVSIRNRMITVDTRGETRYVFFSDELPYGTVPLADAHQKIDLDTNS